MESGGAAAGSAAIVVLRSGKRRRMTRVGRSAGNSARTSHGSGGLGRASVKLGGTVNKGQAIGTVGGENSDYGAHLHFEIRGENQVALDPTEWLKQK